MFNGMTDAGRKYLAKCQATNKPITFTTIKLGNGTLDDLENPEQFTDLKSLKKEVSITNKEQVDDAVRLTLEFSNEGILEGFFLKEIGVYVQDEGQEVLYWYVNDAMEANWLPPASRAPVKYKYSLNILATNLESLVVNWSGSEFFITKEFLEQELSKKLSKGSVSSEYDTAKKIENKIKDVELSMSGKLNKGNLPAKITDAKGIYDLIEKGYGGELDENLLYLNDRGIKQKNYLYFDRNKPGLFRCLKTTTENYIINSSEYYENASPNSNFDRLKGLVVDKEIDWLDRKLFLKTGTVYIGGTGKTYTDINFDSPFPSGCDFISLTSINRNQDSPTNETLQIALGTISKTGARVLHSNNSNGFLYLAFGH